MPKLPSTRVNPHSVEIERLRRAIPLAGYLTLLDAAATTGHLPILDMNGKPTGEYSVVEAKDRISIIHKLIDKAMPDRQEPPMLPEDAGNAKTIDVRNLSQAELEALAASSQQRIGQTVDDTDDGPERISEGGVGPESSGQGDAAPEAD